MTRCLIALVLWQGLQTLPRQARAAEVTITDADHEGRPQLKVATPTGTWYFDTAGGGLSRLIDADGKDWIGFKKEPLRQSPDAAAAGFRGIPNCVHGTADAGAGHPGHDLCTSERVGPDRIRTTGPGGRWQWTWTFAPTHARFRMDRAPADQPWWFLYEGTPGGAFEPTKLYWGTDAGRRTDVPDFIAGQRAAGTWRWAYFGHAASPRVLVVGQVQPDALTDTCGFMGNTKAGLASPDGMVVFGFGRGPKTEKYLRGGGLEFVVGLLPGKVATAADHAALAAAVRRQFPDLGP
jgi:hypothetical protein